MRDKDLLLELLDAETEEAALAALTSRGLLEDKSRWRYLGGMPNNQSIVHAQQSTPAAALIEKMTNGFDALLLKYCKAAGIDPRGPNAPESMAKAVEMFLGSTAETFAAAETNTKARDVLRQYAEENLVLYATGSSARPSLSLYDAGEGQVAKDFPSTFCSLIHGSSGGSYKGAIPFVQGRFNMGSSGVLPFCSEKHKMQLIVSRVPVEIAGNNGHEWAFTVMCFFPSKQDPSWHYLVGADGEVLTGGAAPLGLAPAVGTKSGPREREVTAGTLVKMYDFKAPRSNICGELFKRVETYLVRPVLPLRIIECRDQYKANVMRVTVWDRVGAWSKDKLEEGFESGASASVQLLTGETVPIEIRVFKAVKKKDGQAIDDSDQPQTGLRALINGQSHAMRDANFFRTQAVDKEHIAGSMLVLLDCTGLGQDSRNALFMSNRETFRDDPLLHDLFKKVQRELKNHEGLEELNNRRYEEKIRDAVKDEDGVKALEELLETDPDLADLFGSTFAGTVAAKIASDGSGRKIDGRPLPFQGLPFPTYFRRADNSATVDMSIAKGEIGRVSFVTDVENSYFSRRKHRGEETFSGDITPTSRLFNGRYTLTFATDGRWVEGSTRACEVVITDNKGSGPFKLGVNVTIVAATEKTEKKESRPRSPPPEKAEAGPSRPAIQEVKEGPEAPPLTITSVPNTERLLLLLNVESNLLTQAKEMRPKEETPAVEFVFKYGLALTAMGLLDRAKRTEEWKTDQAGCRERIQETAAGIARVIVPLCLSLPKKLPKQKAAAA
jgi:hypothetical protein